MLPFGITYCRPNETPTLLMLLEGVARRLDQAGASIALRVQRVDGRRADAFVADIHCSRVQSGAAPTVSNVSARAQRGIGSCEG